MNVEVNPEFVFQPDQKKIEIPAEAQSAILDLFNDLQGSVHVCEELNDRMKKAKTKADINHQALAEFIAMMKKRLSVPKEWDITPTASHFYERATEQAPLLTKEFLETEVSEPVEEEEPTTAPVQKPNNDNEHDGA